MDYINVLFLNVAKTSLVASLLVLIIIILRFIFQKRIKANYIYIMWLILLVRLIFPLLSSGIESSVSVENVILNDEIIEQYKGAAEKITPKYIEENYEYYFNEIKSKPNIPKIADKTISVLSIIWIVGIIVILFIPIITYLTLLNQLKKSKTAVEDSINEASIKANKDIGGLKKFSIVKSPLIDTPSLIGLQEPMIILPEDYNKGYEDNYKIFLHEYIHYDKKHLLFQWFFWIIKAIYWFNPLIWVAHYLMKQDAEYVCDEKAVEIIGDNKEYGNLILDFADSNNDDNYMINTVGFSYKKKEIKNRITRIMNKKRNHIISRIICVLCIVLLIPVFFTSYHEIEKQVEAIEISRELNAVDSNDVVNVKVLKYEYSSQTGKLFVDLEYEIDKEFINVFSEEKIYPKFDVEMMFPGSKDPEIRYDKIEGKLYSEKENLKRFSFDINYSYEKFNDPVFRINQIELNVEKEEEIHKIKLEDIPINIKFHNIIDVSIAQLKMITKTQIIYIVNGIKGKVISAKIEVYGDNNGYKVNTFTNEIRRGVYYANEDLPTYVVSKSVNSNMLKDELFKYYEQSITFKEFIKLNKEYIYLGISNYKVSLLNQPADFKLNIGEHFNEKR